MGRMFLQGVARGCPETTQAERVVFNFIIHHKTTERQDRAEREWIKQSRGLKPEHGLSAKNSSQVSMRSIWRFLGEKNTYI